ncbi:hypothetical protein [Psychroserpens ponticola]|uniref:DUF4138 domain-containing protein n=1 Tax=Psychroserpens ponticola TaxID=2932268 RepID=A0ABY7RZK9_9FLAO|nr:hypothetical protein [Psychroserpens ponticola]WCO02177.1 hypothetical protein MUN68_001505 [Psychroserpens ponticola]
MTKNTYIVAALLYTLFSYGQQITFHKNVNYKASTLHQSLNKKRDSLILESKNQQIHIIDIFNKNFSKSIVINSNKAKVDLKFLPIGNFVIQAKIDKKWIIMYLEKSEAIKITASDQKEQNIDYKVSDFKDIETKDKSDGITTSVQNVHDLEEKGLASNITPENTKTNNSSHYYWVVSESNSGFGSSKSMRLEYKDDIAKLISKNKLELKSNVGKNNKLIIYEIYNTSKFMPKQLRNPVYYKTDKSNFFNVIPIYASTNMETSSYNP